MTANGGRLLAGVLALLAAACGAPKAPETATPSETADAIYENASIWTGVEGAARAGAIAIKGDRILSVGDGPSTDKFAGPDTKLVDLGGAFVVPGLIDNHVHFLVGGFSLADVDLKDAASREEFVRRIAEKAAALPKGRWLQNGQWDHEAWGGELPTRAWIDAATPDHPVFLTRYDGHMALANSLALSLAGITAATADPSGGEIVRDAAGEPTGVLKDEAMGFVQKVIPAPSPAEWDGALAAAQAHAVKHGVTAVHHMSMGEWDSLDAFRRARARGDLKVRVRAFAPIADWRRLDAFVKANGRGDAMLRWDGLKGFVDGSLGSTTAWFHEPYYDAPATSGITVTDTDALRAAIEGANAAGLHLAVHAIGDRANDWLLDAYAEAGGALIAERRFRIEHAQHLSKAAIPRFAELGVIASMQPYHAIDDGRWAEKRIGPERIKTTYAFRSLLDAGATLTFGSDWPVAPLDPLQGLYAAATRRTLDGANPEGWVPEEKITVEEALRAYTAANAFAGFDEADLGTLEAGKLADFVVLSADVLAIDPAAIPQAHVVKTIIGGEEVYSAALE